MIILDNRANSLNRTLRSTAAIAVTGISLAACSGGSSVDTDVQTGAFVDSAVQGISFSTESLNGVTNADGEFDYAPNENVTFSIGGLVFPAVQAKEYVSPVDMGDTLMNSTSATTNIARLIQTIDADGNTSNGIEIPAIAATAATQLNFDVTVEAFEQDPDVINFVANAGSVNTQLISEVEALEHLAATLAGIAGDQSALSNLVGFWKAFTSEDHVVIVENGDVVFYDNDVAQSCYDTRTGTLTQVDDTIFLLSTNDGLEQQQLVITREGDTMTILFVESFSLVTESEPTELSLCQ